MGSCYQYETYRESSANLKKSLGLRESFVWDSARSNHLSNLTSDYLHGQHSPFFGEMNFMGTSTWMKKLSLATSGAAIIALSTAGAAQAVVLTFDDLYNYTSGNYIYNGYGGLNWDNFYLMQGHLLGGYIEGAVSGVGTAFSYGGEVTVANNSLFDFQGTYLTAASRYDLSVVVEGLNNGTSLYSKTVVVDLFGPTWVDFNFLGIDQLKFSSFGGTVLTYHLGTWGTDFVIDNFTFNETKSVPEPASTLGLLALGAMGAGSMLKRKHQKKATVKA